MTRVGARDSAMESGQKSAGEPIAIVAMGAMFPGRGTTIGFFKDLIEGTDTIGEVPHSHWKIDDYYDPDPLAPDKTYGKRGGFLTPKAFDFARYGVPPNAIESTDTAQLLALMVAENVMTDVEAALDRPVCRERTSVVLGVASATELTGHMAARLQRPVWERTLRAGGLAEDQVIALADLMSSNYTEWTEATFPGLLGNVVAGRIANRLDLGGSNYVTDAACASSLSALQVAMHELRAGASDMAFAGGADALNDILMYLCFSKTPALSPTGDCRPFSDSADGTILGEGIGMVALKRLADAERDGDRIHAVIRGLGGGSDGRGTAIYAPLASGQVKALRRAYEDAGYAPGTVGLVEAHGTGTQAGDKAELEGLTQVFAQDAAAIDAPWCALGSVKSQIGHTKAAAGAASMIKVAMALSHKVLPPTLKVERPAPVLSGETPFHVSTKARPWIQAASTPRRASVSSFGFGGSNFHATLEEYDGPNASVRHRLWPSELFVFSAESDGQLRTAIEAAMADATSDEALPALADQCARTFQGEAPRRAYILAADAEDFQKKAASLRERLGARMANDVPLPPGLGYTNRPASGRGKVAFLFSGQGSQYVGMGSDLAIASPLALSAWQDASTHHDLGPLALHDKAFPPTAFTDTARQGQARTLTEMVHAQPAIAVAALAQLNMLSELGLTSDMAAGHSFGELVALHQGGSLSRDGLLSLALARAAAMTQAARGSDGAMLAVQCAANELTDTLAAHPDVSLANDNGPQQTVLSGTSAAISAIEAELRAAGRTVRQLPVASAFHSPIVADAVPTFQGALMERAVNASTVPVYANATARPYGTASDTIRTLLANQIRQPVRFREMVQAMYRDGARIFVEIGPGSVVSGLVRSILSGRDDVTTVSLDKKKSHDLTAFLDAIGRLAIAGVPMDLPRFLGAHPAPPPQRPNGKFTVEISGANYRTPNSARDLRAAQAVTRPSPAPSSSPPSPSPSSSPGPSPNPMPTPPSPAALPLQRTPDEKTAPMQTSSLSDIDRAISELSETHRAYMATMTRMMELRAGLAGAETQPMAAQPATPNGAANGANFAPHAQAPAAPINGANGHTASPPMAAPTPIAPRRNGLETGSTDAVLARLSAIISEKTGYPEEMLSPDMHLEAELGIDSIKQVEILSALREAYPGMPDIDPEDMVTLTTMQAIAHHLAKSGEVTSNGVAKSAGTGMAPPSSNAPPQPQLQPQAPQPEPFTLRQTLASSPVPAPVSTSEIGGEDIKGILKAIIAEKTGYPVEMLEDDMDLEAELGVDSIKQVEILSTLRDRKPDLPEVDADAIAELRSIAQLADFFR